MKKSNNLLQNICYILLNPNYLPIIKYDNNFYYIIIMDLYCRNFRNYKYSTVVEYKTSCMSYPASIEKILNIFTGDLVDKKFSPEKDYELWITLEDFNKIRKIINEQV